MRTFNLASGVAAKTGNTIFLNYRTDGAAGRADPPGYEATMAIRGLILNSVGAAIWNYYGDKTGARPNEPTKGLLLARWVFYFGIVSFCAGFLFPILFSTVFWKVLNAKIEGLPHGRKYRGQ